MAIIILLGVSVSFLIKVLVFNMQIEDCLTEYLIIILSPLYQFIRMHMMKVSIYSECGNKQFSKNLLIVIVITLVASAMAVFKFRKELAIFVWQNSIPFIIAFPALFAAMYFIANKFDQIRGHKYENEFDDDK